MKEKPFLNELAHRKLVLERHDLLLKQKLISGRIDEIEKELGYK